MRKLPHELGVKPEEMKADDFTFLTRIHYLAPSDGLWGEHEGTSITHSCDRRIGWGTDPARWWYLGSSRSGGLIL